MIHKRTQTTRSRRLYTAWIPCGEVPLEVGALMSLEKSHLQADRIKDYLESDVDTSCTNLPGRDEWKHDGLGARAVRPPSRFPALVHHPRPI